MINKKFPGFLYGGDYSPDQWPEEVWKKDIRLFKQADINLLTLPVFSWAKLQPSENDYEFEWLDKILDFLAENKMYVCLATSTASQPAWMSRKYPEILPVDIAGRKRTHGKRVNFCPNSEVYRKFSAELARRLAQRYKNHPALLVWHIANEYGTYCYCGHCAEEFRRWVKNRYHTIGELNRRWGLSFWGHTIDDWDEITVPSELNEDNTCNPAVALDYKRFMTDSSLACYLNEYRAIKAVTPDIPVTTNMSGFIKKLDQFRFAKYLDVVGWDNYPSPRADLSTVALKHDLMRGLKDGKPYMLTEQSPNQQNWQPYNKLKRPGEVRRLSFQAVAHGAESVMYFQLRQSTSGVEKLHGAVISSAGVNTRVFRDCARIGGELKRLGSTLLDAEYPARAAIVFDWDNWWAVELSSGPSRDLKYFEQINRYYKAFYDRNIPVDIVRPDGDFSKYKLVVAPLLYMVKQGHERNFEEYVKQGGTAVFGCFSGIVDENDRICPGGYPGRLRKLLGIWVEETDALFPDESNTVVVKKPGKNMEESYRCNLLCDLPHLEGAQAIAVYGKDFYSGAPCVTRNSFGKGAAYYIATNPDFRFLNDFIGTVCENNGIKAPLDAPEGVEVVQRNKGNRTFLFILNHNANPVSVTLNGAYQDLLGGKPVSGCALLEPSDVRVLEKIS